MSKDKKRLVPVRRFKEFENAPAWEQRRLGEVADLYQPANLSSNQLLPSGYPVFGANGYIGFFDRYNHESDQITISARGEKTGTPSYVEGPVWITSNSMVVNPLIDEYDKRFLYSLLTNTNLKKFVTGGAQPQLTRQVLAKISLYLPASDEQNRIGTFFRQLDSLIALHQRKLDKLKRVKSAYLTEMFPAEGEREPKRRFPGFTVAWEQRKLGEVVKRETCQVISSDNNPSVEYDDVVSEQGELNKDVLAKHSVKKGIQFNKNHILYGKLRPYLHNWLNPNFKGVAVGDWWVLKPKNDIKKSFLYALIQTQRYDNVANISTGSKMPRADWNLVSNTNFAIPSQLDEQLKIGEVFSQLDSLITLHQRKPNTLFS